MNVKHTKKIASDHTIILGVVRYKDLMYFAVQDDRVNINSEPHFCPIELDNGMWGGDKVISWNPVSMTVCKHPKEQMITVSENGDVYCMGSGDEHFESISYNGITPVKRGGPLRKVRSIGQNAYAVGMKRQVFKRESIDKWECIDSGIFSNEKEVVGIESIDGFDETDMYTVGWAGEVWNYNGKSWTQIDSPTNLILTDVCCADNGKIYACGQSGTLIIGEKGGAWHEINTGMKENFWSLIWFKNTLYLATFSGVYKLENNELSLIDFSNNLPLTSFQLSAADGLLCSIGAKDIMGFDGESWFRIE